VNTDQLKKELARAQETVRTLQEELAETNRGLMALTMELEKRVEDRTAELRVAHSELEKTNRELVQMTRELEDRVAQRTAKMQEMVDELQHVSYSIAHDMRAPLRALQGFATLLQDECADCPNTLSLDYFSRIRTASHRMDRLITDALCYTKAVLEEVPLEPVDLSKLVRGLLQTYPNLHQDNAEIRIEGELPVVLGNESLLTQCFSNLLGNAVKFVAHGAKPRVRVWAEEHSEAQSPNSKSRNREAAAMRNDPDSAFGTLHSPLVRIWVEDNGIGIPQAAQGRLFRMFQRLSVEFEGTGIGLAIVRKVVERMGGKVGVESEPGKGSRFWVQLRGARNNHVPAPPGKEAA
jgi:signal transduction histidine kinase